LMEFFRFGFYFWFDRFLLEDKTFLIDW
jgi:hypothetical protein